MNGTAGASGAIIDVAHFITRSVILENFHQWGYHGVALPQQPRDERNVQVGPSLAVGKG